MTASVAASPDAPTWRRLTDEAVDALAGAGLDRPGHDARRLVESAAGVSGTDYLRVLDHVAPARAVSGLAAMVERRSTGEPLQYVVAGWAFRSIDLFVDRRVLIPRPETEVTAQWALDALASSSQPRSDGDLLRAADLGTGSGAIALSLAVESEAGEIWATDVSADALEVTRANLAGVGRPAGRVRLAEGCWYEALPVGLRGQIDVVVSNPPYVAAAERLPAEVADWEPTRALVAGATGLEAIETLVAQAPGWLRPGGQLVVEIAPHQAAEVLAMAQATALASASVEVDLAGRPRVLVARAR